MTCAEVLGTIVGPDRDTPCVGDRVMVSGGIARRAIQEGWIEWDGTGWVATPALVSAVPLLLGTIIYSGDE